MRNIKKNEDAVTPVLAVILLVAITVIVAVIIAVFMFGVGSPADAPQAKLRFTANYTVLNVWHEGGDPLIGKDEKIIITSAINPGTYYNLTNNGVVVNTINTAFTTSTPDTLVPGESDTVSWDGFDTTSPPSGEIVYVQVMDTPTGQMVANVKVVIN